jgi:hypothetical protein
MNAEIPTAVAKPLLKALKSVASEVLMSVEEEGLQLSCSNGSNSIFCKALIKRPSFIKLEGDKTPVTFNIDKLMKRADFIGENLCLTTDGSNITLHKASLKFTLPLIDGEYKEHRNVFKLPPESVTFDVQSGFLSDALQKVALCAGTFEMLTEQEGIVIIRTYDQLESYFERIPVLSNGVIDKVKLTVQVLEMTLPIDTLDVPYVVKFNSSQLLSLHAETDKYRLEYMVALRVDND